MRILFILGLPGSGKSSAARYIETYMQQHYKDWSTARKNDYEILKCMSRTDARLRTTEQDGYDGFDVLDHTAFNDALKRLKNEVTDVKKAVTSGNQLITVEFARDNYSKALEEFFIEFLEDAFFLFIDTDIPTCKWRIQARISKSPKERTNDDHYVSDFIFRSYYQRDNRDYCFSVCEGLKQRFGISELHIKIIENSNLTEKDFKKEVELFLKCILSEQTPAQPSLVSLSSYSQ